MNIVDAVALGWIAVTLTAMTVLLIVVTCSERRDRRAAKVRHPSAPPTPHKRLLAARCTACLMPVRYQRHPQGRDDAMALHAAYECTAQLARKDAQ